MKNKTYVQLPGFVKGLFFGLIASIMFVACQKNTPAPVVESPQSEVKAVLDQFADEHHAPELVFSIAELSQAMDVRNSRSCELVNFSRRVGPDKEYRFNVSILLSSFLPRYGTAAAVGDPLDVNQNQAIEMGDLLQLLGYYGNEFEPVDFTAFELGSLSLSGSGTVAIYSGSLVVDSIAPTPLELFPPNNSFWNDTPADETGGCSNSVTVKFETVELGAIYYTGVQ